MADTDIRAGVAGESPLDGFFRSADGKEPEMYGFAFDRAADYLRGVLRKMSDHVGWKGATRPYDFDGFSGYYPEVTMERADICQGDEVVCSFYPTPEGRLGFTAYGDEFARYGKDVNPWYPLSDIMDGRLCLEPSNLEKAVRETHHGREVVYGLRYGEVSAYSVRNDDQALRTALVNRDPNIRLVDADRLNDILDRWFDYDCRPGFEEAVRPELVRLAWDGAKLLDEKQVSLDQERDIREGWTDDWDLIGALREEGAKIRRELQEAAGIPGDRLFKFSDALYPSLGIRDDALFLSADCGSVSDFVTVSKGRVALYCDYDPDKPLPEPKRTFSCLNEALDKVRRTVLGPRNVERAAVDYQKYLKAQARVKAQEVKPRGPKV